ncbi:hypothetical protein OnM2_c1651o44 [Erysiphe neolycopersici]|uniref:Uncharacterized protein n=1 Tax=Erysiphe neolycopersici TaxID=212602 RepID=A0A420I3H1_9PEZI|nr:hypothetical protein OnM2_c1651o44 [Erysiphe neolycopersici]
MVCILLRLTSLCMLTMKLHGLFSSMQFIDDVILKQGLPFTRKIRQNTRP